MPHVPQATERLASLLLSASTSLISSNRVGFGLFENAHSKNASNHEFISKSPLLVNGEEVNAHIFCLSHSF